MKKIKLGILLIISVFFLTGCEETSLTDAKVYTTIYPVKYITEFLYGENSTIESIYPTGVNLKEYNLTDKQIENYASGDLFVYVGVSNEKEIAKSLINKNHDLLIIDATYGLSSDNIEELWLAPNNFLMMSKNIKNSLNDYLNNKIKEDEVNNLYDKLYEKVSWLDAELRNIAKDAKNSNNNTLVVATNNLKFLDNYGFNVVSLEEIVNSGSQKALNDLKNRFKSATYNSILKLDNYDNTELMNELVSNYKASIVSLNSLVTNSDRASDYITIQYENISIIRDLLLK